MSAKLPYPLAMLQRGESMTRSPARPSRGRRAHHGARLHASAEEVELDGVGPMQRLCAIRIFSRCASYRSRPPPCPGTTA